MNIIFPFITLLFFPEFPNGLPADLYIVHLFFFLIFIPFGMIFLAARSNNRENPGAIEKAYQASKAGSFYGYEYRSK